MLSLQSVVLSVVCTFLFFCSKHGSAQDISTVISTFESELESLMCDGLRIGGNKCSSDQYGIQDFISSFSSHFASDIVDATGLAQSIIDRLDKKLNERALFLSNLSSIILSECDLYSSISSETLISFNDLYFSGNADRSSNLPNNMEFSAVYSNIVSLSSSTYKLPNGIDSSNLNIQRDAQISQLLDNTMLNLYTEYCVDSSEYCSMYFGSINGVFRQFPGVENTLNSDGVYNDYDPRFRPWYVSAATGSKDVVILLDLSGSMRVNNRIDLAKEAVISVLNTLGSSSFVNVVAFSDTLTLSCFGRDLVPATSRNVAELVEFVSSLEPNGLTNFTIAFNAAFDILSSAKQCQTSILFLTDGIADDVSSLIKERNTVDIGAVIFSYTLGEEAKADVPLRVAQLTNGIYTHIDDEDDNLITAMSSYYLYYAFSNDNDNDNIILTSPYIDYDTDIVMITMARPIYINEEYFVGVIGTDIPLSFLSDAIGDITIGRKSYSFVINEEAELILHPLIPNAFQLFDAGTDQYNAIFVNDVEPDEFDDTVLPKMLLRQNGAMRINADVKQSAGNVNYNGYIHENAELLYIYAGVGPSSLSIAIVIYSEEGTDAPFVPEFGMKTSPSDDCNTSNSNIDSIYECLAPFNLFHRLDLINKCDSSWIQDQNTEIINGTKGSFYEGQLISTDFAIHYLQSGLFENQLSALNIDPKCDELDELHTLTNRLGNVDVDNLPFNGFREEISGNILNSIYTLSSLQEFWKEPFLANNSLFVSMWFGHYQGLHISYPGKQFKNDYNNLIRPWYQRAISYPDLMVWTTPYKHATTHKLVTGASTVIYAPNSNDPFGVTGFNYQYQQFVNYWEEATNTVCIGDDHCYLIDSSSFCLYYVGMDEDVDDDDISTKFFGKLEPTLMQSLLNRGFFVNDTNVNFQDDTTDITYIVDLDTYNNNLNDFNSVPTTFDRNSGTYTVHDVAKTNLFVIYIKGYHGTDQYPSNCPDNDDCSGVFSPGCLTNSNGDCISATVDVCIKPDSTMSADSSSKSCSTISDLGVCALKNEIEGDMCASNFVDIDCDDAKEDKDNTTTIIIIVVVVVVVVLVVIIVVVVCIKKKKPKDNDEEDGVEPEVELGDKLYPELEQPVNFNPMATGAPAASAPYAPSAPSAPSGPYNPYYGGGGQNYQM